jgi:hypothetical protein
MFFSSIYLKFTNIQAIINLNFDNLVDIINSNNARFNIIRGIYIIDVFNPNSIINLLNNLSRETLIIKFLESVTYNRVKSFDTDQIPLIIELFLTSEPDNYYQTDKWSFKQQFKEVSLYPVPSFNPGITYTNTVVKQTMASNNQYFSLSKSSNVQISASIENVEENYQELSKGSPLPFSLGSIDLNLKELDKIAFNSSSLSDLKYTKLDDEFLNKAYYLTRYDDISQFAIASLITVAGINLQVKFYKTPFDYTYRYAIYVQDNSVNIYARPTKFNDNNTYITVPPSGNSDQVYIDINRFDNTIQVAFERIDNSKDAYLGAIWGYYINQFLYYKDDLTTVDDVNLIIKSGSPTYSLINVINDDSLTYTFDTNDANLNVIQNIVLRKDSNDRFKYYQNPSTITILSKYPFFKINLQGLDYAFSEINILADGYDYVTIDNPTELQVQAFNYSKSSQVIISLVYQKAPPSANYGIGFAGDPNHANLIIANTYCSDVQINKKWAVFDKLILQLVDSATFTFKIIPNLPSFPSGYYYILENWTTFKGLRLKYHGLYLDTATCQIIIGSADEDKNGSAIATPFTITFNKLIEFNMDTYPWNVLNSYRLFIAIESISVVGFYDINEFYKYLTFEALQSSPDFIPDVSEEPLDLPDSYHSSFYDSINNFSTINFDRFTDFSIIERAINYDGRLIRKGSAAINNNEVSTPLARIFDYFQFRFPNFEYIFPLTGLSEYVIPYNKFEVLFTNNNGTSKILIPKGMKFRMFVNSDRESDQYVEFQNDTNTAIFNLSAKYNFFHNIYVTIDIEVDPVRLKVLNNYSKISGYCVISNMNGNHPIEVKTDLIQDYNQLNTVFCGSLYNSTSLISRFKAKNKYKLEIKLPYINTQSIKAYNIKTGTYTTNTRQIYYNLLLQLAYFN